VEMKGPRVPDSLTFHLLGLVHLPVTERYMGCAFTQKIVKLSKMLISMGHNVVLYGCEGSDAPCTEFVQTHTLSEIRQVWGSGDNRFEIGYNWKTEGFRHDFNQARIVVTRKYYAVATEEINKRKGDDHFLLLTQGQYQRPIADKVKLYLTCEPGIGYRGSYANWRAFESAYLMNFTYGGQYPKASVDGHYYDRVIPNYFDEKDFPFCEKKEDYYFFIGRLIRRKGVYTAIRTVQAIGGKLFIAGQGSLGIRPQAEVYDFKGIEFVGYVEPEERAKWLGGAKGVFVPTVYLEAFGGVNVEAQLCGTPVLTTNFGVFPETVKHGVTGFLCNTLQDFVDSARLVGELDPHAIRKHAERYLMKNVRWEFDKWFRDLYQVYLSSRFSGTIKGWFHLVGENRND